LIQAELSKLDIAPRSAENLERSGELLQQPRFVRSF